MTVPEATTVAMAWNPSPDSKVTGYMLLYGIEGQSSTISLDVGNNTSAVVGGLEPNVTYRFSVVAYDAAAQQSQPSNEVLYSLPTPEPFSVTQKVESALESNGGSGKVLKLTFQAASGGAYRLEATADFQRWDTVLTTNCAVDGAVVLAVADMTNYPNRFFRLVQE